ncbi:MAG: AAA family ATPase, partial [Candidatus Wallbacteria bacterium]|nr:AAA family ATPase [Candidatus Wallbacteria bacterium]
MIGRHREIDSIRNLMNIFPVTAILGPRQCGKTTLSAEIEAKARFDLENPRDMRMFENPQLVLEGLSGLVVIDEIQRKPDLFPLLRYLVDSDPKRRYLILGSASPDLIRHSSESLAGRIGYHQLSGLTLEDVGDDLWKRLWLRGGYPRSFIASDDAASVLWRENYITAFLERDIPLMGIS